MAVRLRPDRMAQFAFRPVEVMEAIQAAYQGTIVAQAYEGSRVSAGAATYFAIAGNKSSTPSVSVGFRPTGVELKGAF